MATYISLINYTQHGVQNMKDSPTRLEQARKVFKAAGAELKSFYLVMGRYDAVSIMEAPDDETATRLALIIGGQGSVRTETLRAFTEAEYGKIIAALP